MPHDDKSGFETLGPGRADEVLAERIERARPGQASDIGGRQGGERDHRHDQLHLKRVEWLRHATCWKVEVSVGQLVHA